MKSEIAEHIYVADWSEVLQPRRADAKDADPERLKLNACEARLKLWAITVDGRPSSSTHGFAFHSGPRLWQRYDEKEFRLEPDGSNFDHCYYVYLSGHVLTAVNDAKAAFSQNPVLRDYTLQQLIVGQEPGVGTGKMSVQDLFRSLVSSFIRLRRARGLQIKAEAGVLKGLLHAVGTCGCSYKL